MQFKKGSLTGAHRWNALFHGCPQAGVIFFKILWNFAILWQNSGQSNVKCYSTKTDKINGIME